MTTRDPNDAWIDCRCGSRHWGAQGAAGLALVDQATQTIALQLRSASSHHGQTWALPGGAIGVGESAIDGALREAHEEAAIPATSVRPVATRVLDHGDWSYTTVVASVVGQKPDLLPLDGESAALEWVALADVVTYDLHPAFGQAWPDLLPLAAIRPAIVLDVANILGSRPNGWWRDRAGSTGLLLQQISNALPDGLPAQWFGLNAELVWPEVIAVLEGAARSATLPTETALRYVHAADSGDDAIVKIATDVTAAPLAVVTADRGLQSRLPQGSWGVSPRLFRDVVDAQQTWPGPHPGPK